MSGPINQRYAGMWLRHKLPHLAGGLNRGQHPSLLLDTESPDCLNVDFDGISVKSSRGNKKFNNQTAVRPGLLVGTRVPESNIPVLPDKSVPMMSAVYIPYSEAQDIGGILSAVSTGAAAPGDLNWATQRGRSFELSVSFRLPEDSKLMGQLTLGSRTTPNSTWRTYLQGEELDEFIAIAQKGGDRLTPMSWALGLVNVGNLLDMDVGGGINGLGISNTAYKQRRSNYALCFMWLDAPQFGVDRPVRARYSLDGTQVYNNETTNVSSSFGRYPTFAYRAFIVPWFADPGKNHHVSISLSLDTGGAGTGAQPTPTWNDDGKIVVKCCDDYETSQVFTYDQATPASSNILRYKGPSDSLEYFTKYGIRWWGKDPMFVGLNQRFASWSSAGFIPFGIDAAPFELGGFAMTDMSAHGPVLSLYGERNIPEQKSSVTNVVQANNQYNLRIERNAADATGRIFEINQRGLVQLSASPGFSWGDETGVWSGIGVQGRCPWGPAGLPWAGLGGTVAPPSSGFNPEALRGYRMVLGASATGANTFSNNNAAGQLLSIETYTAAAPPYGGASNQYITTEFRGFVGAPTFTLSWDTPVCIRAFRWVQRPIVVSELRIYSSATQITDYDLQHDSVITKEQSKNDEFLVGLWRFDDGGDQIVREYALQNDGYFLPLGLTQTRSGGVWLSGEGEALMLDIRDNPDLLKQVKAALADGLNGFAINMRVRMGEAYYGLQQKRELNTRQFNASTSFTLQHRFAPVLAAWSAADPERNTFRAIKQPETASGVFSPPQPLIELSHAAELEQTSTTTAARYPMGFSVSCRSGGDNTDLLKKVPGTGSTGIHTWWNNAGTHVNRWGDNADWVGKSITIQVGFDPTGVSGTYKAYIAVNDGTETCFWSQQQLLPADIERSIVTIGGSWSPRLREKYFSASGWEVQGMSVWESCARMVVESVTVYACKTPGSLPAVSGAESPSAGGKTTHPDAIQFEPSLEKLEAYPGGGSARVTNGSYKILPGGASFSEVRSDIERSIIRIGSSKVELPFDDQVPSYVPVTYYVSSYDSSGASINRPYYGPTQNGIQLVSSRAIAASKLDDDLTDKDFAVGTGSGYSILTASSGSAYVSDPLFGSIIDLGLGWRVRVYSNLGVGSSKLWHPEPARSAKLGRGNAIRGIYAFDGRLFAGSRGSLFEVDDRWRYEDGLVALQFREESDRVTCLHTNVSDFPQPSHGSNVIDERIWCLDALVWLDSLDGVHTVAWVGNENVSDDVSGQAEATRWCSAVEDGRPTFCLHSSDTVSGSPRPFRRFKASSSTAMPAGKWTHIRWVVRGNGSGALEIPSCWVDGIPTTVSVDAVADGVTGSRPWVSAANSEFSKDQEIIALGSQRFAANINTQPTFSSVSNTYGSPMRLSFSSGWMYGLDGKLSKVACFTETLGSKDFDDGVPFNPSFAPMPGSAETKALYSQTPVGETMTWISLADGNVDATIYSHPFISLTHSLGSEDNQFSFASVERSVYVANGGRIGVINV